MRKSREAIITMNIKLRNDKDELKSALKRDHVPNIAFEGVVIPRIVHAPSIIDRAMQWYFNGFILSFSDGITVVDPGVDFYSRFTTTGYTARDIRAIFVSHQHLDHCGDLLVFLDILAKIGAHIDLFLPTNVVNDVLPKHYREIVQKRPLFNLIVMDDGKDTPTRTKWPRLSNIKLIKLYHTTPHTFGFSLQYDNKNITYISDTGYATGVKTPAGITPPDLANGEFEQIVMKRDDLKKAVKKSTTLVCNINDLFYNRHSLTHLAGWDVDDMLAESNVRKLVLQHLSPYDANGNPSNTIYKDFFESKLCPCIVFDGSEQRETFA